MTRPYALYGTTSGRVKARPYTNRRPDVGARLGSPTGRLRSGPATRHGTNAGRVMTRPTTVRNPLGRAEAG
jgi:hypothetical protein